MKSNHPSFEVRMQGSFNLPSDPLKMITMEDYELTLALHRTLFNYDDGRRVKAGLIKSWAFDETNGEYLFEIDERARWSDGKPITAEEIRANMTRAIRLRSKFGIMIDALVDTQEIKARSLRELSIPMRARKPSDELFQRLGAQGLALIHPSDWDAQESVVSNRISSGPFVVSRAENGDIILEKNSFDFLSSDSGPTRVILRGLTAGKPDREVLNEFLSGQSWANLQRASSLMRPEAFKLIKERKFSFWNRGLDRLSILRVNSQSPNKRDLRNLIKHFAKKWGQDSTFALPYSVSKARSLQPQGYPLFSEVDSSELQTVPLAGAAEVTILHGGGLTSVFHLPLVAEIFSKLGMNVRWLEKEKTEFIRSLSSGEGSYDLALVNWGAADPDSGTWMSLIMGEASPFLDIEAEDRRKYEKAILNREKKETIKDFKNLIRDMQLRGSMAPLLHYSSLFLAEPGISFELIDPLDETIDFSKLKKR